MLVRRFRLMRDTRLLDGKFAYDDRGTVVKNPMVQPEHSEWADLWTHDFWGEELRSKHSHKSFRPLTSITFRMNFERSIAAHAGALHDLRVAIRAVGSEWLELGSWLGGPPQSGMEWEIALPAAAREELLVLCER